MRGNFDLVNDNNQVMASYLEIPMEIKIHWEVVEKSADAGDGQARLLMAAKACGHPDAQTHYRDHVGKFRYLPTP